MTVDPPPDLAIEVDATSKTQLDAYQALGVPELWRYEEGQLRIDILVDGEYRESDLSLTFANFPVPVIVQFIEQSLTAGRSPTLRAFRKWVQEHLNSL